MKKCKHKLIRTKCYMGGDCYGFEIHCDKCKLEIFGWSPKECEEKLKEVIKENIKVPRELNK